MENNDEKKEVAVKEKKATVTRVHPSGRMVFVRIEGIDRERPVPVARLMPKKDKYEIGDEVTLDFHSIGGFDDTRFTDRHKEIEERRAIMRDEIEKRREEARKTREERIKGLRDT